MSFRLPQKTGNKKKILSAKPLAAVFVFLIGPLIYFIVTYFISNGTKLQAYQIEDMYFMKNSRTPSLYVRVKNNSDFDRQLTGDIYLEDNLHTAKKKIPLGSLGILENQTDKEFVVSWENPWKGSGEGNLNLLLSDQNNLVAEKSMHLAVLPESVTSVGLLTTFLASGLIGVGWVVSRIV